MAREYYVERTALVDADYLAYEAAAWAHSTQADQLELTERVQGTVRQWADGAFAAKWVVLLSCDREDNFRRDHYPLYKAHRTADPPAMLELAQQVIRDMSMVVLTRPRLEADDLMGILATNGKVTNPVIVSRDKDMRQVPGWHYNPYAEDFPVYVSDYDADRLFYQQWLTGDSTDGFGGIKGCGPKGAEKILNTHAREDWDQAVLQHYAAQGYTAEQALAQARCARILRAEDYDSETKDVRPWTPNYPLTEINWPEPEQE